MFDCGQNFNSLLWHRYSCWRISRKISKLRPELAADVKGYAKFAK